MKTSIKTDEYIFSILLQEGKNDYAFEIGAICKKDKTKSSISNLNFIIFELLEPFIALEDYETIILTDKNTGNQIYHEAIKLFNDDEWIKLLTIKLDDDRSAGEWS